MNDKLFQNRFSSISPTNKAGFTMVEVLVAIAFFSAIMAIIFSSFISVFSNSEAIDEGIWMYDTGKTCLNRIVSDLQSTYINLQHTPPELTDDKDEFRIEAETKDEGGKSFSKLRFTSLSHLSFDRTEAEGIAEIVYYIQGDDNEGFILKRSDKLPPFEPFEESKNDPVLCENVKSLTFKFFDEDGTEYDHWDSESFTFQYATPASIAIKLDVGNASNSYSFETEVAIPVFREKKEE